MRTYLLPSKSRRRGSGLRLFLGVSLGLSLGLLIPAAASADEFLEHYTRGLNLYKAEQYDPAIKEFEAAYAQKQFPRTLFNIARSYLKLGKAQEALTYFKRYKELEPSPPASIQNLVTEGVEQAQKLLDALAKPAVSPPTETPPAGATDSPEVEPSPAPLTPLPAPALTAKVDAKPSRPPRPVWRLAVGGAGIGVGAGLIGLGASALAVDGQCISAPPPLQPCKLDYDTLGVGAGLTVSGVILLGAGVVLMAIPERRVRPTPPSAAAATP